MPSMGIKRTGVPAGRLKQSIKRGVDDRPGLSPLARGVDHACRLRSDPLVEAGLGGDPLVGVVFGVEPRPTSRARWTSGSQVTSQTSSHSSARPPSTSRIASTTTATAPSRAARSIAARIRGRTAGWTIASRSPSADRIREHLTTERRRDPAIHRPGAGPTRSARRPRRGPARPAQGRPAPRRRRR